MNIDFLIQSIRYRLGNYLILVLVIALSLMVVANSLAIIIDIRTKVNQPSEINEQALTVSISYFDEQIDFLAQSQNDTIGLNNLSEITGVSFTSPTPYGGGGPDAYVSRSFNDNKPVQASLFFTDQHLADVLDLKFTQGRNFNAQEITPNSTESSIAIINFDLAMALFNTDQVVGKVIFLDKKTYTVVGVVQHLKGANAKSDYGRYTVLFPNPRISQWTSMLIKAKSESNIAIKPLIENYMYQAGTGRILQNIYTIEEDKAYAYRNENAMATLLTLVVILFSFISFASIYGLIRFNLRQRNSAIAISRALGASSGKIVQILSLEISLITGMGVLFGILASIALSKIMQQQYQLTEITINSIGFAVFMISLIAISAVSILIKQSARLSINTVLRQN